MDYRTGEVLAYMGSASYTAKGSERFQPQFDVLADGWRQPGSSIKPLGYLIGIEDKTMTAATMFMDVVTNFARSGAKAWYPTQADGLERGPVRLRNALQFSLNIPAIKAGFINGLEHQFERTKDFGLTYLGTATAVVSESIGTLDVHPIDLIGAYGVIANGGVLMPRHTILKVLDADGKQVWPQAGATTKGERVVSSQAAYIITDILAGNTVKSVNPFWAQMAVTDGISSSKVRPGRVQDRHHERQPATCSHTGTSRRRPTRSCRPWWPVSGWATRTTPPTTASCPWTRPRRCGARSCPRCRRA